MLILIPADSPTAAADGPTAVLTWVRSGDGQHVMEHGRCAASLLPQEAEVVLALPLRALSWHRVSVPKVAGSRLRAALDGLLEERLLREPADLHFALEPGTRPGQTLWVAACDKAWLRSWLQALQAAGRPTTRIVPLLWPTTEALHWAHEQDGHPWLASAGPQGVECLPLAAATPPEGEDTARWLADPAVAAQAEQALDRRFEPVPLHALLLRGAASDWNLAQFDLSLSAGTRRGQQLRQALREFRRARVWRPVRWGLVALLAANLIGLNATAWHEHQSLQDKRLALRQTLQRSFPQVTLVLDAPLQMQREVERLQRGSGQLGPRDLETLLTALGQTAAGAAPRRLGYSAGELQIEGSAEALQALAGRLPAERWQARVDGQTLHLRATAP